MSISGLVVHFRTIFVACIFISQSVLSHSVVADELQNWQTAGYKPVNCVKFPIKGLPEIKCFGTGPFWRSSPNAGFQYDNWSAKSNQGRYYIQAYVVAGLTGKSLSQLAALPSIHGETQQASGADCPYPSTVWDISGILKPPPSPCLISYRRLQASKEMNALSMSGLALQGKIYLIQSTKYDKLAYFQFGKYQRSADGSGSRGTNYFGVTGGISIFYRGEDNMTDTDVINLISILDFDLSSVPNS